MDPQFGLICCRCRYFVQNPSTIRGRLRDTLSRPLLPIHFILQLRDEALLHRQQLLYPIPYALPLQVSPSQFILTIPRSLTTSPPGIDQHMTPLSILSASNTCSAPVSSAASSSIIRSTSPRSSGRSPSSSNPSPSSPSYSCSSVLGRQKPSRRTTWRRWACTELCTFLIGYTGECTACPRATNPHSRLRCRYFTEGVVDPIAVTAGLVQTGLYLDFFYVYFTKCVHSIPGPRHELNTIPRAEYSKERSSNFPHNLRTCLCLACNWLDCKEIEGRSRRSLGIAFRGLRSCQFHALFLCFAPCPADKAWRRPSVANMVLINYQESVFSLRF